MQQQISTTKESKIEAIPWDRTRSIRLGLLIVLLVLLSLLDQTGYVGSWLFQAHAFLFGVLFFIPLLGAFVAGIYWMVRRQKKTLHWSISPVAVASLFFFLLVGLSAYDSLSLDQVTTIYLDKFSLFPGATWEVVFASDLGGGAVGHYGYALLHDVLTPLGAKFVSIIGLVASLFFVLKPVLFSVGNRIVERRVQQQKQAQEEVDAVTRTFQSFFPNGGDTRLAEELEQELKKVVVKDVKSSPSVAESTHGIPSFSIDEVAPKIDSVPLTDEPKASFQSATFDLSPTAVKPMEKVDSPLGNREEVAPEYRPHYNIFQETVLPSSSINSGDTPSPKVEDWSGRENRSTQAPSYVTPQPISPSSREMVEEHPAEHIYATPQAPTIQQVFKTPTPKETRSSSYRLPGMNLLSEPMIVDHTANRHQAEINRTLLNNKFESLGMRAEVRDYLLAPAFTRFQIEVESDVKIGVFNQYKNDIMMALSAERINILTPIPGTSYVGIEVPNTRRSTVSFKEVFQSLPPQKKEDKLLTGIGKDITGNTVSFDISATPHLLVAGTTGSGKSVCINTIICSLLMRASPDEVRLLLVDPKRVEMNIYAKIPHLLCPVVTDAKQAAMALKRIVEVVDERYTLFNSANKKNIDLYNKFMRDSGQEPLPYYVVVIDELADLMLIASKDVEDSILRITQLARAAGIHLIVATQRPSVDIITGVIKANIPSRIAFAVSSLFDSRTILDTSGAEELLGKGDMLLSLTGAMITQRVQGAFISDDEIERIVEFVSKQRAPNYEPRFLDLDPPAMQAQFDFDDSSGDQSSDDLLYQDILDHISNLKQVSTSYLQRKFNIGFSRGARMLDRLEDEGYIGPMNGSKPRDVRTERFR